MANSLYDVGRQSFLANVTVGLFTGQTDWVNDRIWGRLIDTSEYSVDLENHTSMSDVPIPAMLGNQALTGMSAVDGVASANTLVFPSVPGGRIASAVILYRPHTTNSDPDAVLLAYIDTGSGFPLETNGTDVNISWDSNTGRIFRL